MFGQNVMKDIAKVLGDAMTSGARAPVFCSVQQISTSYMDVSPKNEERRASISKDSGEGRSEIVESQSVALEPVSRYKEICTAVYPCDSMLTTNNSRKTCSTHACFEEDHSY